MDHRFPLQLFPSFYNHGPPNSRQKPCAGGWGSYERVIPQEGEGPGSSWSFTSRHQVSGETWLHAEPVPVPLLSPRSAFLPSVTPPEPADFTEHMQNFFTDHSHDAFGCMSNLLGESFDFAETKRKRRQPWESADMSKTKHFLDLLKSGVCQRSYQNRTVTRYCSLLSDVVHDIPPQLLGSLLHEELAGQRDGVLFSEAAIGGALAFVPFSQSHGCLLYPGGRGLDRLNFHGVALQFQPGSSVCVDAGSRKPLSFQLKAPIRQISCTSLFSDCCVGVRSDHLCGVWRFSERSEPRLLQVIHTREVSTCVNVSPHVLGEVLVAGESGAAELWTVGKGFQKVRVEDSNLYFNAKSPWRWCEFSAHPRVMLYADRTGAELTDMRVTPSSGSTLFRISSTSECRRGERLILSRYLGDGHPFHHLVTTQYSAYILDERFPCVPMLKWDHMMASPPVFCHVAASSDSAQGAAARTAKVLLGSHSSQEMVLLQYSGGRAQASVSRGPPQALLRPRDSLKHLPVQIPHRLQTATGRLSAPAAGLTCILHRAGGGGGREEHMCVLQLTEAGDVFCQTLELLDCSPSGAAAAESSPPRTRTAARQPATPLDSDSWSHGDAIGPTQATPSAVPETPEGKRGSRKQSSDSSSEGSEYESRRRKLRRMQLEVFMNDEPETTEERAAGGAEGDEEHCDEDGDQTSSCTQHQTSPKLSSRTLMTWKLWLQKLMRRSCEEKPRPRWPEHLITKTKVLHLPRSGSGETSEKEQVACLQQKLQACMHGRSLLLHSAVAEDLRVASVPELVNTDVWTDPLSQRLTLSWQGESAWKAWWDEELGLNRDAKMQSLRRKRRRQKEARRAAGHQWELSHSFTSSCSSQSQLEDFSDSAGCSSTLSQRQWSDTEGPGVPSQLAKRIQHENQGGSSPSLCDADAAVPAPATTPQRPKDAQSGAQIPDPSQTPPLSQMKGSEVTPANQRRTRRPTEDYLSALFPTQDHSFHNDEADTPPGLDTPSSSQLRGSRSVPLRSVRPAPSTSPFSSVTPSQLLSGSQRGLRPSQASQPKKKRPQMGF